MEITFTTTATTLANIATIIESIGLSILYIFCIGFLCLSAFIVLLGCATTIKSQILKLSRKETPRCQK